jgi:hypothetical protein
LQDQKLSLVDSRYFFSTTPLFSVKKDFEGLFAADDAVRDVNYFEESHITPLEP